MLAAWYAGAPFSRGLTNADLDGLGLRDESQQKWKECNIDAQEFLEAETMKPTISGVGIAHDQ